MPPVFVDIERMVLAKGQPLSAPLPGAGIDL